MSVESVCYFLIVESACCFKVPRKKNQLDQEEVQTVAVTRKGHYIAHKLRCVVRSTLHELTVLRAPHYFAQTALRVPHFGRRWPRWAPCGQGCSCCRRTFPPPTPSCRHGFSKGLFIVHFQCKATTERPLENVCLRQRDAKEQAQILKRPLYSQKNLYSAFTLETC